MRVAAIISFSLCTLSLLLTSTAEAKSYGSKLCANDSRFSCYTVKDGDTWDKLFTQSEQRDLVMRLNRINIRLASGIRIAIPKDINSNTDPLNYAPIPKRINPTGTKTIIVSLNENELAFGAYNREGNLEYWGPVSGGRGYCPDTGKGCHTAVGNFSIYRKGGATCKSTKFPIGRGGAPMPYCMFFNGGFALHGSYDVPGYNASHGCVRLFVNDAKWLDETFTRDEDTIHVVVKSSQI